MKSVLISIQPKWCELIASGKKLLEVRKTRPKIDTPFKCYIYCTKGKDLLTSVNGVVNKPNEIAIDLTTDSTIQELNGKVIGEFVCDKINCLDEGDLLFGLDEISDSQIEEYSCLSLDELFSYKGNKEFIYGWHISDLVIYDKPKELSEFFKIGHSNYCKLEWEKRERLRIRLDEYNKRTGYKARLNTDSDFKGCLKLLSPFKITRPPQSWCYVENDFKE